VGTRSLAIFDSDLEFARRAAALAGESGYAATLLDRAGDAQRWLLENPPDLLLLRADASGADRLLASAFHHARGAQRRVAVVGVRQSLPDGLDLDARLLGLDPSDAELRALFQDEQGAPRRLRTTLVGRCAAIQLVRDDIARAAPLDVSVLVTGETGTGKELVARALHEASGRSGSLVCVNCGAIPAELLGSQLFGHERGSFTGAWQRHTGYFEQAQGGTLFLDELGEMPQELQVYLLRCLETRTITRLGSSHEVAFKVRIVAATHRDLCDQGSTLRRDLYYRLTQYPIALPPLRERGDDVQQLAQHMLDQLNRRYGTQRSFDAFSAVVLSQHAWPGNVRELSNVVERSYYRSDGRLVTLDLGGPGTPRPAHAGQATEDVRFAIGTSLKEVEQKMLERTLSATGGDKTAAAKCLGISVRTIHNHLSRRARG
jgi:DNA-binding NtrC family response regulator